MNNLNIYIFFVKMSYVGRNIFGQTDIGIGYFFDTYTIGNAYFQFNENPTKILVTTGSGANVFRISSVTGSDGFFASNGTIRGTFTLSTLTTAGFLINDASGVVSSSNAIIFPITFTYGVTIRTNDTIPLLITDNSGSYQWYVDATNRRTYQNMDLVVVDSVTGANIFSVDADTRYVSFFYGTDEMRLSYNSVSGFPMFQTITNTGDYVQFPRLLVGAQNSGLIDSDLSFQFRRINGNVSHYMNSTGSFFTNASIATQIIPTVDNAVKLGSTSFRWSEVNAFNATLRGDVVITGTNSIGKLQVYNGSGLQIMGISTTTSSVSMYYTTITGDLTISSLNSATKFRIRDNTPNDLLVFDTTTPKLTIGNATRPVTVNFANGTASSFMKLDASLNLTYDTNTYLTTAAAAATYITKVSPVWSSGTFSTPLTATQLVATNGSSQLTTIAYSQTATANSIVQRDSSGNVAATTINTTYINSIDITSQNYYAPTLTVNTIVATDAFNAFVSLPYSMSPSLNTIVQRDGTGDIACHFFYGVGFNCSGLTASQLIATDSGKNFVSLAYSTAASANTIVQRNSGSGITIATLVCTGITCSSINCSTLTASQLVATDASKNFVSIAYDTAATGATIVQRNVGGGIIINTLTSTSISCTGITCSGLTATRLVATDGTKNFISLSYATAATASAMVQRDGSAGITVAAIACTNIVATGTVSVGSTNNASKFNVSDNSGNSILNVSTVASGGYCPIDMDNAKLSVGNLGVSSFVQTDSSGYLTTSKTLSGATFTTSATLSCDLVPGTTNTYKLGSTSSVLNTIYTSYLGFGGATTWDLNMQLQAPNAVFSQARCPAWNTYSNRAMKENILPMRNAVETVKKLRAVEFTWKKGYGDNLDPRTVVDPDGIERTYTYEPKKHMGFIAEEICEVLPYACSFDENGKPTGVDYSKVVPLLVAAIQELLS